MRRVIVSSQHFNLKPAQVMQVKSLLTPEQQATRYGEALWTTRRIDAVELRKVEPLTRALKNFDAWITGIRRDQAPTRANAGLIEWDDKFELVKVNPLGALDIGGCLDLHPRLRSAV